MVSSIIAIYAGFFLNRRERRERRGREESRDVRKFWEGIDGWLVEMECLRNIWFWD